MTIDTYLRHNQVESIEELTDKAIRKFIEDGHAGAVNKVTLKQIDCGVLGLKFNLHDCFDHFREAIKTDKSLIITFIENERVVNSSDEIKPVEEQYLFNYI